MPNITPEEIAERNEKAFRYGRRIAEINPELAAAILVDPAQGCFYCVWSQRNQRLVRRLAHGGSEDPDSQAVY